MTPREQAPSLFPRLSRNPLPSLLVILLLGLMTTAVLAPSALGTPMLLASAAVTLVCLFLRCVQAVHVGFLGTLNLACIIVPALAAARPLSAVVAVGIYIAVVSASPWLRRSAGWEGWNPPRGLNLVLSAAVGLLGFSVIMGWVWLLRPDLSGQAATVPQTSLAVLVLFGLAFAVLNSFAEEAVFRGVFLPALRDSLGSPKAALVMQAVVFGLMHVRGFPSGLSGMAVAGVIGLAFGSLRLRTRGILAPWLAHAIVNALMYAYLAVLAGRTIP